jgi:hypothetical protein
VIVRQSRGHLDFAEESLSADLRCDLRSQNFHSNRSLVAQITGEIYDSHAALTELSLNIVTARES